MPQDENEPQLARRTITITASACACCHFMWRVKWFFIAHWVLSGLFRLAVSTSGPAALGVVLGTAFLVVTWLLCFLIPPGRRRWYEFSQSIENNEAPPAQTEEDTEE